MTIVRTRFGLTHTVQASHWYAGDIVETEKKKFLVEHKHDIGDRKVLRGPELIDENPNGDSLKFAWVSEVEE